MGENSEVLNGTAVKVIEDMDFLNVADEKWKNIM